MKYTNIIENVLVHNPIARSINIFVPQFLFESKVIDLGLAGA